MQNNILHAAGREGSSPSEDTNPKEGVCVWPASALTC